MTQSIIDRLGQFIRNQKLLPADGRLLLAVSGGLDSVVLLSLFMHLRDDLGLTLGVVHVNHGIRGDEADADQLFVKKLAEHHHLPFFCTRVDAVAHSRSMKLSLEEAARNLRYDYFQAALTDSGFSCLATAHNANDQAETVLDHFLRGSGAAGLSGILSRRGPFIRPLLPFTRAELVSYASESRLEHREDASNRDLSIRRNRIRHQLIPLIQEHFNPGIMGTLNRSAAIFQQMESQLDVEVKEAFKSLVSLQKKNEIILEIKRFLGYNNLIQTYLLFHCCKNLGIQRTSLNFPKIRKMLDIIQKGEVGRKVEVFGPVALLIDHDGIVLGNLEKDVPQKKEVDLLRLASVRYHGRDFRWTIHRKDDEFAFTHSRNSELLDFEKVGSRICFRTLYAGARFFPLGLGGQKKVADLLSDRKIPIRQKQGTILLETDGDVVWVCGHRIDERFKVTEATRAVLKLEMENTIDD